MIYAIFLENFISSRNLTEWIWYSNTTLNIYEYNQITVSEGINQYSWTILNIE